MLIVNLSPLVASEDDKDCEHSIEECIEVAIWKWFRCRQVQLVLIIEPDFVSKPLHAQQREDHHEEQQQH